MKKLILVLCIIAFGSTSLAVEPAVTPKPAEMKVSNGFFELTSQTAIYCNKSNRREAETLAGYLNPATGFDMKVLTDNPGNAKNAVVLITDANLSDAGDESYQLDVRKDGITLTGTTAAGLFYGIQTLRQLLPAEIYGNRVVERTWRIPCVSIKDKPSYPWRGMMLDVSRYFFDVDYVKRYMEMMAMHKLNVLHLHIVDDPGWRIAIDKYPELTEIGGFRGKGANRYGGYYTKDQIREIVQYASKLHIDIVPEIELPAHCQSALAALPWLGCTGKQLEVPTKCYISPEILCAGKESTYEFLKNVLSEVVELFPGKYIHIGGDEVKCDRWKQCPHCEKKRKALGFEKHEQLQSYMTLEIEKFLMTKGRRLIGWDEILDNGLAPNATVMTWHRPQTAVQAARSGNNVVMALTGHAYFDTPESKLPGEPPAATWLPPISLSKAYEWEPAPAALTDAEKKFILGAHGCLWTDRFMHNPILQDLPAMDEVRSLNYVDYLSLPRMAALGEVVWTPKNLRRWSDFSNRQKTQYNRYTAGGFHFRVPLPIVKKTSDGNGKHTITMTNPVNGADIHYTTDGTYPTVYSEIYSKPVTIEKLEDFSAVTAVSKRHYSLAFKFPEDKSKQYAKYGEEIGRWKSGQISAGTCKPVQFDATGKISKNGVYEVTFIYTSGQQRLDIQKVEVVLNGTVVAKDVHNGIAGGQHKGNVYRLKIDNFETGANYTIRANIMGDTGSDSNGIVLIKAVK